MAIPARRRRLPSFLVNVPFAPIPTAAVLTSLSPAMWPAGTVVTLFSNTLAFTYQ